MAHHSHEPQVTVLPPDKEKIKRLWKVAGILGLITAVEFAIAFLWPHVGEFMHLRYEAKFLFWAVLVPILFIIWMLVAFVYEGMKMPVFL